MEVFGLVDLPVWAILLLMMAVTMVIYVVYMCWDYNIFKKMGVDGPKPTLVLGNLGAFMTDGAVKAERDMYIKYGTIFGAFEGKFPTLYIADPALIKDIMVKDFNNFVNRRDLGVFDDKLADSMTSLTDDHWRFVRNVVSPTFSGKKLRLMTPLINSAADRLVENLEAKSENDEDVEIKAVMSAYTLDVIASTAFGLEIDSQKNPDDPFIKHMKSLQGNTLMAILMACFIFFPFLSWLPRFLQTIGIKLTKNATDFFCKVTDEGLKDRRDNPGHHADFLELMAHAQAANEADTGSEVTDPKLARKKLTDREIRSQAVLFFFAGYDTTSNSLSFILYHLAIYPEILDRVLQEVDDKLGEESPTYDNVNDLTYLDMVSSETMRLFPPAARIDRVASRDVTLGNVRIPKGMVVNMPVGAIQMDPQYWPDPEKFDPERFTPEAKADRDPFVFLPFGAGPRNCIGMRLAVLEQKICLARILQHYRPVKSTKTVIPVKISKLGNIPTDDGIWIKFERRVICMASSIPGPTV